MSILRLARAVRRARGERGVEAMTMIIAMPFLLVMILALVDIGMMFKTRLQVEGITADAARAVAFEGGNNNPRLNTTPGTTIADRYEVRMWDAAHNRCALSLCRENVRPSITCSPAVTTRAGEEVQCTTSYQYRGYNQGLLNSPLGMGLGRLIRPFTTQVYSRAETGTTS
jgi:Flp pilus assembly protein TadG